MMNLANMILTFRSLVGKIKTIIKVIAEYIKKWKWNMLRKHIFDFNQKPEKDSLQK